MIQVPSPDQIREVTEAVLARPEFGSRPISLWERVFDWLAEVLPAWSVANPLLSRIVVVVLTGCLIALVAYAALSLVRDSAARRPSPGGRRSSLLALEEVGVESWAEARGLAREALGRGDVYRALWITHRMLLSILDRTDRLRFARWKTNGDYLGECPPEEAGGQTLADVTAAYERVVYAHRSYSAQEAGRLLTRVEALAAEAER